MKTHKDTFQEHRKYVRLETVFPVEFQILSKEANQAVSSLMQGFTRNVSEGGICLEVSELDDKLINEICSKNSELELFINLPHSTEPIKAIAMVRWNKKIKEVFPNKYLFGLEYINIEDHIRKQIFSYAKSLHRRPKLIAVSIALLIASCAGLIWQIHDLGIKKGVTEKQLLQIGEKLAIEHENRLALETKIYAINTKGHKLKKNLMQSKNEIRLLEERLQKMSNLGSQLSDELLVQKITLENKLKYWNKERDLLNDQLEKLNISKGAISNELKKIKELGEKRIIRVRLVNGNYITGQLIDLSPDRLDIKIGMGSIGIERNMITNIKELSYPEKVDIQKIWEKQEREAREDEIGYKKFIKEQEQKGLVYLNGTWVDMEEAQKIEKELKEKEEEVFKIIAQQRAQTSPISAKSGILEKLIRKEIKPIISLKDKRVYINGNLFFIKGVGYGIEYPGTNGGMDTYKHVPLTIFEKDFQMIKEAGINTIRTYEPLPEKLLDLAEKYNIMVIENVCYPSGNTDFGSKVHLDILKEQVQKYVNRDKDRKCILMWSVWNDAPWAWGASGNVVRRYGFNRVNKFLKELYQTVKGCDNTHPVTASNAIGLEGESLGWDFLDVIGLNLYVGGYDWYIEEEAKHNIAEAQSIADKYNKPVVILETGFSTFIKGQDQAEVIEKQIKIVGTNLSGITIFQWADGWQKAGNKDKQDEHIEEYWGILDGYRKPKPGYKAVCKLFNETPTESNGYNADNIIKPKED